MSLDQRVVARRGLGTCQKGGFEKYDCRCPAWNLLNAFETVNSTAN